MRLKPKKSLGQNFLLDKNIRSKIIQSCALDGQDTVLEIGPGTGELTRLLAERAKKLFAVELDQRLLPVLEKQLESFDNCRIIHGDILKIDLEKLLKENGSGDRVKVIANIPYYISSPIIEYLIDYRRFISEIFITVQKEFARRVCAVPGSREFGSFSCFVSYYCDCRMLFAIKKNSFRPAPKVDSCFLSLSPRIEPAVKVAEERFFFRLIRTAFNQRRKTLRNSLEGLVDINCLEAFFEQEGINKNIRPEALSLAQFASLSDFLCRR